jgi:hypothetical protein
MAGLQLVIVVVPWSVSSSCPGASSLRTAAGIGGEPGRIHCRMFIAKAELRSGCQRALATATLAGQAT